MLSPNEFPKNNRDKPIDYPNIINQMHNAIRLKHYSYSTERSYLDWVKRFFDYLMKYKGKEITRQTLNSQDVRAYLSYLALRQRVSSSTQNQAFNALLFLFNEVLHIELSNLGKTVRAKRGPKLPVVLTPEEVQKLFKQVESKNLLILQLLYGICLMRLHANILMLLKTGGGNIFFQQYSFLLIREVAKYGAIT